MTSSLHLVQLLVRSKLNETSNKYLNLWKFNKSIKQSFNHDGVSSPFLLLLLLEPAQFHSCLLVQPPPDRGDKLDGANWGCRHNARGLRRRRWRHYPSPLFYFFCCGDGRGGWRRGVGSEWVAKFIAEAAINNISHNSRLRLLVEGNRSSLSTRSRSEVVSWSRRRRSSRVGQIGGTNDWTWVDKQQQKEEEEVNRRTRDKKLRRLSPRECLGLAQKKKGHPTRTEEKQQQFDDDNNKFIAINFYRSTGGGEGGRFIGLTRDRL